MAFPGNQYKLLALDLDGTLLNEKNQVSPRDAQAVRRAQERGVQIVLCTGRNVREVRAFSDQLLAPPDWLVTSSGAAVQRPQDAEPQFFSGLSLTHCEDILTLCEEFETDPLPVYHAVAVLRRRIPRASAPSGAGRTDRHERGGRGLIFIWTAMKMAEGARKRGASVHKGRPLSLARYFRSADQPPETYGQL